MGREREGIASPEGAQYLRCCMGASSPRAAAGLPVFVYGTLKAGLRNHASYCHGVTSVLPAEVWGRLYAWEPGIPILAVPRRKTLLLGSADVADDLRRAQELLEGRPKPLSMRMGFQWRWRRISGELLSFPDPVERLRLLDALEGFNPPTGPRGYQRVLIPVRITNAPQTPSVVRAAWVYILPFDEDEPGRALKLRTWSPGSA